jgi:hypothetical protein
MNKYWKFQGKIITLSSFLSAPKKWYNLHTLGPQWTFAKKWWALKVLMGVKQMFSWKIKRLENTFSKLLVSYFLVLFSSLASVVPLGVKVLCRFVFQNEIAVFRDGGKPGAKKTCGTCNGRGVTVRLRQLGPGMVQQMQSVCQHCHGEGKQISNLQRLNTS